MLRIISAGNALPVSYPVSLAAIFEPGMIAQLTVVGSDIVATVSDGTAPLGIIDDFRASAFTGAVVDEIVVIYGPHQDGYFTMDSFQKLQWPYVIQNSFDVNVEGLELNDINGILIAPAGTPLNYDSNRDGVLDSLKVIVAYHYRITSQPGDDTTANSGRMTIWVHRLIGETDQFDTTARYAVNANLFVNPEGRLTTRQATPSHPAVALCLGPPTGIIPTIEFMWL